MKSQAAKKRYKTFPLDLDEGLHKALKHRAIESDQSLHTFIIETLKDKVREKPIEYDTTRLREKTSKTK